MVMDYLVSYGDVAAEMVANDLSRNYATENYHSSSSSNSCMEKSRVAAWFMVAN